MCESQANETGYICCYNNSRNTATMLINAYLYTGPLVHIFCALDLSLQMGLRCLLVGDIQFW